MKLVCATGYVSQASPSMAAICSHVLTDGTGEVLFVLRCPFDLDPVRGQLVRVCGLERGRVFGAPRRLFVEQVLPLAGVSISPMRVYIDPFAGPAVAAADLPSFSWNR